MAIAETSMHWYYSGGVNNTVGSASFGGARAQNQGNANKTYDLQSTITTGTAADLRILFDSARIGDGVDIHVGKAMLIIDGTAVLGAARILEFDNSNGRFLLEAPFEAAVGIGDTYELHVVDSMFDNVTAAQCATGHTDYRCVYFKNETGGVNANVGMYYHRVLGFGPDPADVSIELWARKAPLTTESTRPNDESGPPASQLLANDKFVNPVRRFDIEATPAEPYRTSTPTPLLSNNDHRAVWVKRIIPPNARRNDFVVVQICCEFESDDDQTIVTNSMLMVFSLTGFTPAIDLRPDRGPVLTEQQLGDGYDASIRLGHGARMIATVTALETGLPVPDLEIGWTQSGPGELWTPDGPLTDSDGIARATYSAPDAASVLRQTVSFDSSGFTTPPIDSATTLTHDHTILAGTERVLLAWVLAAHDDDPPAGDDLLGIKRFAISVTFGGVPLVRIAYLMTNAGARIELWQLLNPAVGLGEMVMTSRTPHPVAQGFCSTGFSGVDQSNPLDVDPVTKLIENDAGTTFTQEITTVTDGCEFLSCLLSLHPVDFTITTDAPAAARTGAAVGVSPLTSLAAVSGGTAATAGAQSIGFSGLDVSQDRLGIGVALRPALVSATVSAQV